MVMCSLVCFAHKNSSKTAQDGDQMYSVSYSVSVALFIMKRTSEYGKIVRGFFNCIGLFSHV